MSDQRPCEEKDCPALATTNSECCVIHRRGGRCLECGGSGLCWCRDGCELCSETGKCSECKGTGWMECTRGIDVLKYGFDALKVKESRP